mmetsp:Transcript_36907/g.66378  ORF Transcript_36907/g.66378 Transcript_36907/m.66378 type:complete len:112 (-) Transcript_36907:63-398(-)
MPRIHLPVAAATDLTLILCWAGMTAKWPMARLAALGLVNVKVVNVIPALKVRRALLTMASLAASIALVRMNKEENLIFDCDNIFCRMGDKQETSEFMRGESEANIHGEFMN